MADETGLTDKRKQELAYTVVAIRRCFQRGDEWGCYVYASEITELYEQLWLWLQLNDSPKIRSAIKRFQLAEREYDAKRIKE
jgi:hypothetical protein